MAATLIDGLVGKEINEKFKLDDVAGFVIGYTLTAHRLLTKQRGILKNTPNAKELLNDYIDFVEKELGF